MFSVSKLPGAAHLMLEHRRSPKVSLRLAILARWLRRLRCRLTVASSWCKSAKNHLVSHISSDSLCKFVYIVSFWQTWKSLSTCQSFWVFRQIVLYLPISYQWLKLQDLHVAPTLSEPLKKAGRWQVTHWPNDKCLSCVADNLCGVIKMMSACHRYLTLSASKGAKSHPIESTKAACLMFERLPMTAFSTGRVLKWVCD